MARSRQRIGSNQTNQQYFRDITVSGRWLFIGLSIAVELAGVGVAGWVLAEASAPTGTTAIPAAQGQVTALQPEAAAPSRQSQPIPEPQSSATSGFLGAETDYEGLVQAEAGELGEPALVWFHADWCHVCQAIKPTVAQMEKAWDGKVKLVRLNVDDPKGREAALRHRVRGTPTFVFISRSGDIVDNMVGWPGQGRVEQTLSSLLAAN